MTSDPVRGEEGLYCKIDVNHKAILQSSRLVCKHINHFHTELNTLILNHLIYIEVIFEMQYDMIRNTRYQIKERIEVC